MLKIEKIKKKVGKKKERKRKENEKKWRDARAPQRAPGLLGPKRAPPVRAY